YERKETFPVPASAKTLAIELDRATVTIVGEARTDVAVELSGVVFGSDEQLATALEQQIAVAVSPDGPILKIALTLPKRDNVERRPRVQLTVKVPTRLGVEL